MLDVKGFLSAISSLEDAGIPKEVTLNALKESFESIIKKKLRRFSGKSRHFTGRRSHRYL